MDVIKKNITNLTSLWKIGGQLSGHYIEKPDYCLSIAGSGAWPNKLWFTKPITPDVLENIQKIRDVSEVSYPIWGEDLREQELILKAARFEEKLAQVAMSIRLEEIPKKSNRILIKKVTDERMANTWSQLFLEAFGYEISAETVTKTMNHMEFFVGMHNEIPIGTAILFIDKFGTAGIHSMGIIPSQRRQGFAEELLIHTLHSASGKGASLVTLQASAMGKGLYLKTGFQEDFIIKTFIQLKN